MCSSNTEDLDSSKKGKNSFFLWLGLACLIPLACLFLEIWNYPRLMSAGLAMRVVAASLLIQGEQPYYDFWDWSQPIVYELLKYPYMLCTTLQTMQVPLTHATFIPLFIFCLVVGSTLLTAAICAEALKTTKETEAMNFVSSCLVGLTVTALISRFDFGDLQYLLLLTIVPWLALRWFAHREVKVHTVLACATGVIAAIGACLDLPYLAVFIILELILTLQSGRWRCLLAKEWLAFILTIVTNLLFLSQLPEPVFTAFWKWTMPLKCLNYSVFDYMIYAPQACPNRADVIYGMVAAGIISFLLGKKYSIYISLPSLMFAGFALYLLEGQGSSKDLVLTMFAITTIFTSALLLAWQRLEAKLRQTQSTSALKLPYQATIFVMVLIATLAIWQSLERDRNQLQNCISVSCSSGKEQLETLLEQTSKVGDAVSVISHDIEPAYPLLFISGRKPGGYLLWARPLWLFSVLKANSNLTGPMKEFYDHTYANIRAELEQKSTKLLILSNPDPFDDLNREQFAITTELNFHDLKKNGYYLSYKNHQPREYSGYNFPFRFLLRNREKGI